MKPNILIAFPYFKKQILETLKQQEPGSFNLMVDSGAFTAHQLGEPIDLDEYCKFLDFLRTQIKDFKAVQLDVIGNHEATFNNYKLMKSRGFDVMPVFTRGSPVELMDELYKTTDYILIGGIAFGAGREGYIKWLHKHIRGRKAHLLGFTGIEWIKYLKPTSIDSSGCTAGERYGRLLLYQGMGKIKSISRQEVSKLGLEKIYQLGKYSKLSPSILKYLTSDNAWISGGHKVIGEKSLVPWLSIYATLLQSYDIEKHLKTRLYLAISTSAQASCIFNAHDLFLANTVL